MEIFEKSKRWLKVFWYLLVIDIKCLPKHFKARYYSWRLRRIERTKIQGGWYFAMSPEIQALEKEVMGKFAEVFPGATVNDWDSFLESPPFFSLRFLKKTVLEFLRKP